MTMAEKNAILAAATIAYYNGVGGCISIKGVVYDIDDYIIYVVFTGTKYSVHKSKIHYSVNSNNDYFINAVNRRRIRLNECMCMTDVF